MKLKLFSSSALLTTKNWLWLLLIVLCFRLFYNAVCPVAEPSEARYANICRNMAVYDNFLEPQFIYNGVLEKFEGKPPLYFQSGGLACKIFGCNEFSVRFPALLSGIAILLLVYFGTRRLRDEKTAVIATLFCALTPIFYIFCGLCMTDLMLAASIFGAVTFYMLFSAEPERRRKKVLSILFFASLGVGMLVKGPVAIVLAGMPVFFWVLINKRWSELKFHAWICGPLAFLLIAVPWYWMMQAKNPDFLEYFFINENFKRFLFKSYGDRYGAGRETFRGVALLFFLACNLPFLLTIFASVFRQGYGVRDTIRRIPEFLKDPLIALPLLLSVTTTLFWCLTSRVLITYLLPTIPATSIVLAELLVKTGRADHPIAGLWIKRVMLLLFVSCWILPAIVFGIGSFCSFKLAGHFFRETAQDPAWAAYRIYVGGEAPHFAEFYLGDRAVYHKPEPTAHSMAKSRNCVLLIQTERLEELPAEPNRKRIAKRAGWVAFAPEQ